MGLDDGAGGLDRCMVNVPFLIAASDWVTILENSGYSQWRVRHGSIHTRYAQPIAAKAARVPEPR